MAMFRVLIAESFDIETLRVQAAAYGIRLHEGYPFPEASGESIQLYYHPAITEEAHPIAGYVAGMDALMVRPKAVTAADIAAGDRLKLIIRGGAGVNAIDLEAARRQGVVVENTPGLNSAATAEFTFALLLELLGRRCWLAAHRDAMIGRALPPEHYCGAELRGKTLAILGMGHIGTRLACMAQGFGMKVRAFSRSLTPERAMTLGVDDAPSPAEAVRGADAVSLHVPLSAETRHLVRAKLLAAMRPGVVLLNTARPALIDPEALECAVVAGRIGGLGVDGDVARAGDDPAACLDAFLAIARRHPQLPAILTPHIADTTREAQVAIARQCLDQAVAFFTQGRTINRVA